MTRSAFNRNYTAYELGGTTVYLCNGSSFTTEPAGVAVFNAGQVLTSGQVVYLDSATNSVFLATALSGQPQAKYFPIGVTVSGAAINSSVFVNLDSVVWLSPQNITAESTLVPGAQYYLSKYDGQVVRYSTASGVVSNSGTYQYGVLSPVGRAINANQLEVELCTPVLLQE